MNESTISVRYAKALFLLSKEKAIINIIKNDIELLYNVCNEVIEFNLLLENPVAKTSEKLEIINKLFLGKIDPYSMSFINLVLKNKREKFLKNISRNYLKLYREEKGVKKAILTSAVGLDATSRYEMKELIRKTFNTEIDLVEKVDDSLIGGFVLRVEDLQIDSSVASRLKNLKRELLDS